MKLTVLGKYGPYGKAKTGAASGYLVQNGDDAVLLDMGSGTLSRLIAEIDIERLSAVFISHLHFDHTSDLLPFRYLLEEKGIPITIYTHREESDWYRILFSHPLFNVIDIDETSIITVGSLNLTFFEMNHPITNYAIRIQSNEACLVYTGDTKECDNLYRAINGADLALMDCSKPDDFVGGHMTRAQAIDIHKRTNVRILATHLSPDFVPDFSEHGGITVAEEGKTYLIGGKNETL